MIRRRWRWLLRGSLLAAGLGLAVPAAANPCLEAIDRAELRHGIPAGLLRAVGVVESGRPDDSGQLAPWPWTLNVAGKGQWFPDATAAWLRLSRVLADGERSVDVGCMQVNLAAHPKAFARPGDGLDPEANVDYAARFLVQLQRETGSWEQASAYYHSRTPGLGDAYRKRVDAARSEETSPFVRRVPLGSDYRVSPIQPAPTGFDPKAVLAGMRESRRIHDIVRKARDY